MLDKALNIIESLNRHNVEYVIIGGYAIILHGFLRATEDIDIILKMNKQNVENFQNALLEIYDDPDIKEINYPELLNYPVIRYGTPDNFYIDVIAKLGDSFYFDNVEIEQKIIEKTEVKYASAASLLKMKQNTLRDKDKVDILFLKNKLKND